MEQSQSDVVSTQEHPGLRLSKSTRNFLLLLTLTLSCAIIYSAILMRRTTSRGLDASFQRAVGETAKLFNLLKESFNL